MPQLSEQAQKLVEDFEKMIETLPAHEREEVLKRMASHVSTLNEDEGIPFEIPQASKHKNGAENLNSKTPEDDIDNISSFI